MAGARADRRRSPAGLVVDASVTAAWCFKDESSAYTDAVLDVVTNDGARVPALWPFEMANVLAMAERRGWITTELSERFLDALRALPIEVESREPWMDPRTLAASARAHALTAYDASYLDLAIRSDLPLATRDRELRAAAERARAPLFGST